MQTKGKYSPKDIAEYSELINATNDVFSDALSKGIKNNVIPAHMMTSLENDVFVFSALKTHAQLFEASRQLLTDDGKVKSFQQFSQDVEKIKKEYNQSYLQAEYNFAVASAQQAANWAGIEENGDRYNLQYRTAGDDRVRDDHAALNRTTLPSSDPFWNSYYPPNGWNCRCTAVEVLKDKYSVSDSEKAIEKGDKATTKIGKDGKNRMEIFRFNPGKEKVVFPPNHPYNKVVGENIVKTQVQSKKTIEYKNFSENELKQVYNNQNIDVDLENNIMGTNGYVATANSFYINEKLRNSLKLSSEDKKVIGSLDGLINTNKLKDNVILYRNDGFGFVESHFKTDIKGLSNDDAIKKLKESKIDKILDKGYLSTSAIKTENAFTHRKIHSEIRTKKGTNVFIANNFSESEIILGRNQKLNIIDIIEEDGKIKIIMETDS